MKKCLLKIMTVYSLLSANPAFTVFDIELDQVSGNIAHKLIQGYPIDTDDVRLFYDLVKSRSNIDDTTKNIDQSTSKIINEWKENITSYLKDSHKDTPQQEITITNFANNVMKLDKITPNELFYGLDLISYKI